MSNVWLLQRIPNHGPWDDIWQLNSRFVSLIASSDPDLKDPSKSKAWVHELHNIQKDLQSPDVSIKSISEVNVLHLRDSTHCAHNAWQNH